MRKMENRKHEKMETWKWGKCKSEKRDEKMKNPQIPKSPNQIFHKEKPMIGKLKKVK